MSPFPRGRVVDAAPMLTSSFRISQNEMLYIRKRRRRFRRSIFPTEESTSRNGRGGGNIILPPFIGKENGSIGRRPACARTRTPFHFRNWNGARIGIVSTTVAEHDATISIIGQKLAKECYDTITGPSILPSLTNTCNQTAANMKGTTDCDATAAMVIDR